MSHLPPSKQPPGGLSRRAFLKGAGGVAAAGGVLGGAAATEPAEPAPTQADVESLAGRISIRLRVNGEEREVEVEPRTTLLNALRNHCDPPLTGSKLVCDRGNCGACTVHLDGRPVYACLQLAADVRGREIKTIEAGVRDVDDDLSRPGPERRPRHDQARLLRQPVSLRDVPAHLRGGPRGG